MTTPPSWKPGDPIPSPVGEMVTLDVGALDPAQIYRLLIGVVVPRPIAFVSTISPEGVSNLAPFSWFNAVSADPPCVMIAISRKSNGGKKDTLVNIEATGEFVVNMTSEWLVGAMNHCSTEYPYGVSEFEKAGFGSLPSTHIKPARVQESPVHMECKLEKFVTVGDNPNGTVMVIGRVVTFHIHAPAYSQGRVKIEELKPVSRLGGLDYGLLGSVFSLPRPRLDGG